MTFETMRKDKIILRKTDPLRATAYNMIINLAEQTAKKTNRSVVDTDIAVAAKAMKNQLEATILEYEKGSADTSDLKAELAIYAEFIPKGMPEEEVRQHVEAFLSSVPAENKNKSNAGKLKGSLKQQVPGIDMAIASKILDEML